MSNTVTTYTRSKKRADYKRSGAPKKQASGNKRRAPQGKQSPDGLRLPDWAGGAGEDVYSLPGWEDVNARPRQKKNRKNPPKSASKNRPSVEQISTRTFALYTFIAVILLGLYVSHVFATQQTLENLEQLERENLRLTLEYDQKNARFKNHISPDEVYRRAQELGLQAGTDFGPPVIIDEEK